MSRSRPQERNAPNPATRWFEWNAKKGNLRYYDKLTKEEVEVALPVQFVVLDQLASIGGWNEASKSAIYSNQVRDTTKESLLVRAFKGGTLGEGFYRDIRDHITSRSVGGHFTTNCYVAFKNGEGALALGVVQFKGAALGAWIEFSKAHRDDIQTKAVKIAAFTESKKGGTEFRIPVFKIVDLTKEMNNAALGLDADLQTYLDGYLRKNTREQVERPSQVETEGVTYDVDTEPPAPTDADLDEVPF